MVSYANNLTRPDGQYSVILEIEGIGHWLSSGDLTASASDGLAQFSYEIPSYADTGLPIHRDYVAEAIDILSERVAQGGGFPELGGLNFALVDVDDYLTGILRTHRAPSAQLTNALDTTTTTFSVNDTSGMSAADADGGVLYLGSEAMRVTAVNSGTSVSVERGYLGTDAVAHTALTPVRFSVPYLAGRRVTVKLVPQDADSVADETTIGTYVLDGAVNWDPALNVWRFQAKGQLKYLHRRAPIQPRQGRVIGLPEANWVATEPLDGGTTFPGGQLWSGTEGDTSRLFYMRVGREIVAVDRVLSRSFRMSFRGLLGTEQADPKVGDTAHQVFLADTSFGSGSFRFSPGGTPSTQRGSGTWTQTDHWVDLMLIIMTSSAGPDEGDLIGSNYNSTYGNFASLPVGYGLGLPHTLIDWDSWMDVRARTPEFRFPYFAYGDEPMSFGELVTKHFLKPMGAYLSVENGTAKIILPRLPVAGSSSVTIGPAEILTREIAPGEFEPRHDIQMLLKPPASVTYEVGPDAISRTYANADFAVTYGQRGYYAADDKGERIQVPSGDPARADIYAKRAASKIFRQHVPVYDIRADLVPDTITLNVGDQASYSQTELPDLASGTRDWTSVTVEKLAGEIRVPEDDTAHVATRLRGYGPDVVIRKTCPSAYVASVSTNTATVAANRYTQSDATGGLPTTDAAAFAVGNVVRLRDLAGVDTGGGTQTITSISGNDITLDGNFGGALTSGEILVYSGYDNADSTTQQAEYAFMADRATNTKGTGAAPDLYGET